jgi:hypothetical protein
VQMWVHRTREELVRRKHLNQSDEGVLKNLVREVKGRVKNDHTRHQLLQEKLIMAF